MKNLLEDIDPYYPSIHQKSYYKTLQEKFFETKLCLNLIFLNDFHLIVSQPILKNLPKVTFNYLSDSSMNYYKKIFC